MEQRKPNREWLHSEWANAAIGLLVGSAAITIIYTLLS